MRSLCMLIKSVLKVSVSRRKGTKERGEKKLRAGHLTPSFLTDDNEEFQSNIDLHKSFNFRILPQHQSKSVWSYTRF